jgi:hypothetical protein
MNYVMHVFMTVLGWNKQKADRHIMELQEKGKSILMMEGAVLVLEPFQLLCATNTKGKMVHGSRAVR